VPVLLGSLARLPMGMLTDRFGGRAVFTALMLATGIAAWLVPATTSYGGLLVVAFFLGLAGSSFAVGATFVARWTPSARQGTAVGIYGLGNGGQSLAVFGGPVVAGLLGWQASSTAPGPAARLGRAVLPPRARPGDERPPDGPRPDDPRAPARADGMAARRLLLPHLRRLRRVLDLPADAAPREFGLSPADAGFRAAGFVVLATAVRPGRRLAGRSRSAARRCCRGSSAARRLRAAAHVARDGARSPSARSGARFLLGLGNGAVFKLVPERFPKETGTVTGLVGALGGLGGFFPPIALGIFRDTLGVIWPGFVLLSHGAGAPGGQHARLPAGRHRVARRAAGAARRGVERVEAGAWAALVTLGLAAAIVVGSRNLRNFDAALVGYTFATLFATFGITYRYAMWLKRPPTRMYWRRGWQALLRPRPLGAQRRRGRRRGFLEFAANRFIFMRGRCAARRTG
jgi:MFS transporter, NNP family, nitrate/nitrite transporter